MYIRNMNSKNKYILLALILIILIIAYFSVFVVKEEFTSDIRGMYNPRKREIRLYADKLKKKATEYVDTLQKTFSWA
jgi:capsular polysaccharide biosynthesis protein